VTRAFCTRVPTLIPDFSYRPARCTATAKIIVQYISNNYQVQKLFKQNNPNLDKPFGHVGYVQVATSFRQVPNDVREHGHEISGLVFTDSRTGYDRWHGRRTRQAHVPGTKQRIERLPIGQIKRSVYRRKYGGLAVPSSRYCNSHQNVNFFQHFSIVSYPYHLIETRLAFSALPPPSLRRKKSL